MGFAFVVTEIVVKCCYAFKFDFMLTQFNSFVILIILLITLILFGHVVVHTSDLLFNLVDLYFIEITRIKFVITGIQLMDSSTNVQV